MQGDHIEIALHHHRPVVLADGTGGPIQAKQVLALLEHLGFRGIEVFGFAAIKAAPTKPNHPSLAVLNGHHHPMAKTVVEAIPPFAGYHQPGGLEQLGPQPFHLLEMLDQAIPLLGGVPQFKTVEGGLAQPALSGEIGKGALAFRTTQLATKPARSEGEHLVELLAAGELLAQALLLGAIEGFDRQLVLARQLQHHIAEAVALELHQKLDGIPAGTTGEAVVELLGR